MIFYQYAYTIFTMKQKRQIKNFIYKIDPNDGNSFVKRLAMTYSAILLVMLVVGFGLYSMSSDKVTEGIQEQNRLTLAAGTSDVLDSFRSINAIASQLSGNATFVDFVRNASPEDQDFYLQAYKLQRNLVPLIAIEQMLPTETGYVYMKNSGYIMSYSQFTEASLYYRGIRSFNNSGYEQWLTYLTDSENWYKLQPASDFHPGADNLLYVVPLSSSNSFSPTQIPAVLCYEYDHAYLMQLFSDINLFDIGYIVMQKPDGSINFVLSSENLSASNLDTEQLVNADYHDDIAFIHDNRTNTRMMITRCTASGYGTVYLVQPASQALYSLTTYKSILGSVLMLSMLLGIAMVYLLALYNAKPVMELSNELLEEKAMAADLSELVRKHRPIVAESFVRKIMEGSVTLQDEMVYIKDVLHLTRTDRKYCVLLIKAFPASDTIIHSDNLDLCIQNYDVLVRDAISRYFPDTGYVYKPDDRHFAVLLSSDAETDASAITADFEKTFVSMHHELLNHYGIWISAGIGNRNGRLDNTWKSYQQAKDALSATTTEQFVLSNLNLRVSDDLYYYPESYALQMSSFISSGNREKLDELFQLLIRENTATRHLSATQMRWLVGEIRTTLFKKRHHMHDLADTAEKQKCLDRIDRMFEEDLDLNRLKNIALMLSELCISGPENGSTEMIARIQDYISRNYSDSDLCLTKISDEFGISENYFSFLFKKISGENFSVYLEKLRMAEAKTLVCETTQPLSNIYELVGYNNSASFRRAFKKIFGISPKEMREKTNGK